MVPSPLPRIDSLTPDGRPQPGFHSLRATARTEQPPSEPEPEPPPPRRPRRRWVALGTALSVGVTALFAYSLLGQAEPNVQPRIVSGTPQKKLTEDGNVHRWHQREVVVHIDERLTRLGPGAWEAIDDAFAAWMAEGPDVPIVTLEVANDLQASAEPDGINAVVLDRIEADGHENDLAITIAFSDSKTGEIVEADIIVNTKHPIESLDEVPLARVEEDDDWHDDRDEEPGRDHRPASLEREAHAVTSSCTDDGSRGRACGRRYDIGSVMTHEVGHFFGLGEDEKDGLATMFYCTSQCETHKRTPESTEIATMTEVYADGYDDAGEVECSVGAVGAAPRATYFGALALLGGFGLIAASRRVAREREARARARRRRR